MKELEMKIECETKRLQEFEEKINPENIKLETRNIHL